MLRVEKTDRRILFVILMAAVIFLAASIAGAADAYAMSGEGTSESPYKIQNDEDWEEFAGSVRTEDTEGVYYELFNDINITLPVGTESKPFEGHFNGRSYTITATISDNNDYTAIFRYINGAVVSNFTVEGTIRGGNYTAGAVGHANGESTVSKITVNATVNGADYVGGIVGHGGAYNTDDASKTSDLTIQDCTLSGELSGTKYFGGIMGWGDNPNITFINCLFKGTYQYRGTSSGDLTFHPIALKNKNMTPEAIGVNGAYYGSRTPAVNAGAYKVTDGTLTYMKDDADTSVGKFYKAAMINGRNSGYYYPVTAVIELQRSFYQSTDQKITYTFKVNDVSTTYFTDYVMHMTTVDYPNIRVNETDVLAHPDAYRMVITGVNNYLGVMESRFYVTSMTGKGTESEPYVITSNTEWNQFRNIMVTGEGYDFADKYVKLANNIPVNLPVGTAEHPFSGVFDGQNKTLTNSINVSGEGAAPFRYIKGATIKNITSAGTVKGDAYYAAGLVGFALVDEGGKANTIDHATVTANVTTNDYAGGVIGHGKKSTIVIKDTIFSGKLTCDMFNRRYSGAGFVCWNDGAFLKMDNCINKGSKGSSYYWWNPIALVGQSGNYRSETTRTYYKENVAKGDDIIVTPDAGGTLVHTSAISGKVSTKVKAVDNVTYYIDEGIKITGIGILYKYTGSELNIPYQVVTSDGRELAKNTDYTEKFNTTVKNKGDYTLTITGKGNYSGSISAKFKVGDQLNGSGTKDDPYRIEDANHWAWFKAAISNGYTYKNEYVKLTNNISIGNVMAGTDTYPFEGTFDGAGHKLTAAISGSTKGAAPFAYVKGATIKDLTVAGSITGGDWTSGLIGQVTGSGVLVNGVTVEATVSSAKHLAGFVGNSYKQNYVRILSSTFSGELKCTGTTGYVGGFAGWATLPHYGMTGCLFKGKVTGKVKLFHPVGLYSASWSGYYGDHNGILYHTTSGNQIGSDDNYALVMQDWNVAPKHVYSRNEFVDGELYMQVLINGEKTDCYQISENSKVIVDDVYVTKEGTPAVVTPEVKFGDERLDRNQFTFKYYKEDDYGDPVEVSAGDLDATGTYMVKAIAKDGGDFAGWMSASFRVIAFAGEGTYSDPYYLGFDRYHNDWEDFVDAIAAGHTFKGEYIKIANADNISVTRPAGTEGYPFQGTFSGENTMGYNNTLDIDLDDVDNQGTAMFRYVGDGAVIQNLNITGTVKGGRHSAGLVGFAKGGKVEIYNVRVSASITNGDYVGGVIGHGRKSELTIIDTAFTGKITGGTTYTGGILGWSDGQKLNMERCIFSGQYLGAGSFHPIAVRNRGVSMNTNVRRTYYLSTQGPAIDSENIGANGTPVYTKATYPDGSFVSRINAADGKSYYADTTVGALEESYEIYSEGITPVPTVADIEGTQLQRKKDYTAVYYSKDDQAMADPLDEVTEIGEYTLVLKGNNDKTLGEKIVGSFEAESSHVSSVTLNKESASLNFDEDQNTVQLEVTVKPDTAANKEVEWTSDDEDIAAVDENGLVTAVGEGETDITVTSEDGGKTASCHVTVERTMAEVIIPPSKNLLTYNGEDQKLVNPGTASGGKLVYQIMGETEFKDTVPTAKDAGDYFVVYKAQADDIRYHKDSIDHYTSVTIAKAPGSAKITSRATVKTDNELDLDTLVNDATSDEISFAITDHGGTFAEITDENVFTAELEGTCKIEVTVADNVNYTEMKDEIIVTVEAKELHDIQVTMDDWTYLDQAKDPVFTIPEEYDEEDLEILYVGTKRDGSGYVDFTNKPEEAGMYMVFVIYESQDDIYTGYGHFMIMPRNIEGAEVTLGKELAYTGEPQEQTISKVELEISSDEKIDITEYCSNGGNYAADEEYDPEDDQPTYTVVNAGDYIMVVAAAETSNYTGTVEAPFTVAKADPTYTAPKAVEGLVYNGSMQILIEPGTVDGGVMKYNYGSVFSDKLPEACDAGTYQVRYRVKGDMNHKDLNDIKDPIDVTIAPAVCHVDTAPTAAENLVYTGEEQALVTAGASADGDMMYRLGDSGEFSTVIPHAKDAGEYEVYYKAAARDDNHADSKVNVEPIVVEIGKVSSVVTKEPEPVEGLVYDGEEHALVTPGEAVGGTMLYSLDPNGEFTEEIPAAADKGQYNVFYKVVGDNSHEDLEVMGPVSTEIGIAPFPGKIQQYVVRAGYGEEVDLSEYIFSDFELEYSIFADETDDQDCTLDGSVLTTGNSTGKCSVLVTVKGDTGNYDVEGIYVNVSNISWTDIKVYQDDIVYGKGVVDPSYDEYAEESDFDTLSISYVGTMANGEMYGDDEEEFRTPPTEAGEYTCMVFYMIDRSAYSGDVDFAIRPADMKDAVVTLGNELYYNGEEQTQEVAKVELDGKDITDLCGVSNNKATDAGTYQLAVYAKDDAYNYIGSTTAKFIVYPDPATLEEAKAAAIKELTGKYKPSEYSGSARKAVEKALADAKDAINKARSLEEIDAAKAAAAKAISANKKTNTMNAKGKTIKAKFSKVRNKTLKYKRTKAVKVTKPVGKVTYKRVKVTAKKKLLKQAKAKIKVAKNGKITLKKGLKKGTYKIRVKVRAAGNKYYKAKTKTVTVKVVVK